MPITSGSIEYERRLNLGEYNHKNVVAKISWTVEPGEDEFFLGASAVDKVVMRVKDVLNWKPAIPDEKHEAAAISNQPNIEAPTPSKFDIAAERIISQRHIEPNIAAPDLATAVAEITAGVPPTLKRHRRTKAEMEAARAAEANPTLAPEDGTMTPSSSEPGMPSFDPEPTPPAEVTDPDLQNACQARASSGVPVVNIKELIAKFSPGGPPLIPQNARRRFLDELAKL